MNDFTITLKLKVIENTKMFCSRCENNTSTTIRLMTLDEQNIIETSFYCSSCALFDISNDYTSSVLELIREYPHYAIRPNTDDV